MRSLKFADRDHNRYWWYRTNATRYVPPVLSGLSDAEWAIMEAWFDDTEAKYPSPGEISIPGISLLSALIGGNGISSVVQCGHYVGYSTLLLGFLLRSMDRQNALFSIDIDPECTAYTQGWIERAGLDRQVRLAVSSSSDPTQRDAAFSYLGKPPQLVLIDSSHRYDHTLEELDLWYDALVPGGLLLLHDVSDYARAFDSTSSGGVRRAAQEWSERRGRPIMLLNSFVDGTQSVNDLTYRDGCGMGILQKPMPSAVF